MLASSSSKFNNAVLHLVNNNNNNETSGFIVSFNYFRGSNSGLLFKMKVKLLRWHGVASWKWDIDEDVSYLVGWSKKYIYYKTTLINVYIIQTHIYLLHRYVEFVECHLKHVVQVSNTQVMIVHHV